MYNNKLVASIRVDGQILREYKDKVFLKYGSEYSILLKNLNTVRALVNVYIDGENVVPGGLALNAGQEIDLERSIKNNNLTTGNRFKFVQRTDNIEQHRDIKTEDGIIRIEYQFEKVTTDSIYNPPITAYPPTYPPPYLPKYPVWPHQPYMTGAASNAVTGHAHPEITRSNATLNAVDSLSVEQTVPQTEIGITVPGSQSNQSFVTVDSFPLETKKHNIILQLLGETQDNRLVSEPVTVKSKPTCSTCGKTNKATAKFCSECGTSLQLFA